MVLTDKAVVMAHHNHLHKEDWDRFTGLEPVMLTCMFMEGTGFVSSLVSLAVSTNHGYNISVVILD